MRLSLSKRHTAAHQQGASHRLNVDNDGSFHGERLDAIRQLLEMFRVERLVYLAITMLSVFVLLLCAVILLWKRTASYVEIFGLFGSSGGITYSTGRLLKMWSDAIQILLPHAEPKTEQ